MSALPDDFEAEVKKWRQHVGTPPFVSSPAWEEAQRRKDPIAGALRQLLMQAQPRPDLITPGSNGELSNPRPVTFLGRVVQKPESIDQLVKRFPQGELESGGMGLDAIRNMGILGMAKAFKPGPATQASLGISKIAQLAKPGTMPKTTDLEKMLAAVIDEKSGQVIHGMSPYRPGDHGGLETIAATLSGFRPTRGFVDPATFDAFTEAMMEEALMRNKGFLR